MFTKKLPCYNIVQSQSSLTVLFILQLEPMAIGCLQPYKQSIFKNSQNFLIDENASKQKIDGHLNVHYSMSLVLEGERERELRFMIA